MHALSLLHVPFNEQGMQGKSAFSKILLSPKALHFSNGIGPYSPITLVPTEEAMCKFPESLPINKSTILKRARLSFKFTFPHRFKGLFFKFVEYFKLS